MKVTISSRIFKTIYIILLVMCYLKGEKNNKVLKFHINHSSYLYFPLLSVTLSISAAP